jgi:hypothetical protein
VDRTARALLAVIATSLTVLAAEAVIGRLDTREQADFQRCIDEATLRAQAGLVAASADVDNETLAKIGTIILNDVKDCD